MTMLLLILLPAVPFAAVAEETYEAKIVSTDNSETHYATLSAAAAALTDGDTLVLLSDVTVTQTNVWIKGNNITVDGNGKSITYTGSDYLFAVSGGTAAAYTGSDATAAASLPVGTVTFKNMNITAASGGGFKFYFQTHLILGEGVNTNVYNIVVLAARAGGTLTVDGGVHTATNGSLFSMSSGCVVNACGGYGVAPGGNAVFSVASGSTLNVYGGYFENTGAYRVITGSDTATATINVYGGALAVRNVGVVLRSGGTRNIYGGAFSNMQTAADRGDGKATNIFCITGGFSNANPFYTFYMSEGGSTQAGSESVIAPNGETFYTSTTLDLPETNRGASARLVEGSSGLRFTTNIPKAIIDYASSMADSGTQVSYGTVICPTDYLATLAIFTMDGLDGKGRTYQNIVAEDGITENADGSVTIRAALVDIQKSSREFSAVGYLKYIKDGHVVYIYGIYDRDANSRSMEQIATAALNDIRTEITSVYAYPVEGGYSPYSPEQRAILLSYVCEDSTADPF